MGRGLESEFLCACGDALVDPGVALDNGRVRAAYERGDIEGLRAAIAQEF